MDRAILRHSRAEWREESFRFIVELCCAVSKRLGIIVFTQVDNSCKKQQTRRGKGRAIGKQTLEKGCALQTVKGEDRRLSHKLKLLRSFYWPLIKGAKYLSYLLSLEPSRITLILQRPGKGKSDSCNSFRKCLGTSIFTHLRYRE